MRFDRLRRREFVALLGGATAWPLTARGQQPGRTYRLGFLLPSARESLPVLALFDELRINGFVEGQNLSVTAEGTTSCQSTTFKWPP
jgi:putative ABC transport system substrate-binding protein